MVLKDKIKTSKKRAIFGHIALPCSEAFEVWRNRKVDDPSPYSLLPSIPYLRPFNRECSLRSKQVYLFISLYVNEVCVIILMNLSYIDCTIPLLDVHSWLVICKLALIVDKYHTRGNSHHQGHLSRPIGQQTVSSIFTTGYKISVDQPLMRKSIDFDYVFLYD